MICAKKVKNGVGAEGLYRYLMTQIIQDLYLWLLRQNVVMAEVLNVTVFG